MKNNLPLTVEKIKVKATHVAQTCPVCNSFGTVTRNRIKCHACDGKGYILIPAEEVMHDR